MVSLPRHRHRLNTAAATYEPQDAQHQIHALDWLQHEIATAIMVEFERRWLNQPPPPEPLLYPGDRVESVVILKKLLHRYEH